MIDEKRIKEIKGLIVDSCDSGPDPHTPDKCEIWETGVILELIKEMDLLKVQIESTHERGE